MYKTASQLSIALLATGSFVIASLAISSPAVAEQHATKSCHYPAQHYPANHYGVNPGVVVVEPAPAYPGPVSQVDRWRFQQSIREYHEAIAAQNRAEVKRRELEIAQLKVQRDALTESVVEHKANRLLARRVTAASRANQQARQLWQALQSKTVSWPVAFDSPWAMERLGLVVEAVHRRNSQTVPSGAAEVALEEIEQAVRTQQLTDVRSERTDALKTLASLRRIVNMDDAALYAMQ